MAVLASEVLLTLGLLLVGRHYVRQQLQGGLDAALQGRAMSVAALVRYPEDNSTNLLFEKGLLPTPLNAHIGDLYEVRGPGDVVISRSPNWTAAIDPGAMPHEGYWQFHYAGHDYRAIRLAALPILDEETGTPVSPVMLSVAYASSTREMNEQLSAITAAIVGAGISLLLLTGLLALGGIRRSLRPLRTLAAQAAAVSPRNWNFAPPAESAAVSELRPLVLSLQTMLDSLRRAYDQQRDFIASAAHELKTPVAIQKSTLQLLLHKPRSNEEYKAGLDQCLRDTERLEDLLQRMLRLARADQWAAGDTQPDLTPQLVSGSCEDSLAGLKPWADSRNVALNLIPDGDVRVLADAEDLRIIWANLVQNAIQYSPAGGAVTVKIGREEGTAQAVVSVSDNGDGIAADQLPRVFDRFFRGDRSRSRETGGVGLGLAIVKALVEAYGGNVSVASERGRGSTVVVRLPLAPTETS